MRSADLAIYIVDTHALFWYRRGSSRLSVAADAVFRLAAAGGALIVVPAIVVAELFYLTHRLGTPISISEFLRDITHSQEFMFSELGQAQLECMERIDGITEMHDRLIAAEALVRQAPIISRDEVLRESAAVQTIW